MLDTYISINKIDEKIAILGIVISIVISLLLFLTERYQYLIATIFMMISCTCWYIFGSKLIINNSHLNSKNNYQKLLVFAFFTILSISLLILNNRLNLYERPTVYFICIAILAGIVVYSILTFNSQKLYLYVIIFEIVALGLLTSWSQLLIFPDVVGVDPYFHKIFTNEIIATGIIPNGFSYSDIPIFHIIIAITSMMLNCNYKIATIFSVSFVQIVIDIFIVYLLGKAIFGSDKIGLVASLFIIISNYHILRTYWSIPNSLAIVFIIVLLYLLLIIHNKVESKVVSTILIVIIMISLILTHSMGTLAFLIILMTIFFIQSIYHCINKKEKIREILNFKFVILFPIMLVSWWTYASFFTRKFAIFLQKGFSVDFMISENVAHFSSTIPLIERIFPYVPEFIFYSIAIIGLFYFISNRGNLLSRSIGGSGIILLIVAFTAPLLGGFIIEDRWRFMSQVLLTIPASVGIILLISSKNKEIKNILVTMLIIVLTFFMILTPFSNQDNHLFNQNSGYRFALTEGEIHGIETISDKYNGEIGTDQFYCVTTAAEGYNTIDISKELEYGNFNTESKKIIIIRSGIVNQPFWLSRAAYKLPYDPYQILMKNKFNKIICSKSISGFS